MEGVEKVGKVDGWKGRRRLERWMDGRGGKVGKVDGWKGRRRWERWRDGGWLGG